MTRTNRAMVKRSAILAVLPLLLLAVQAQATNFEISRLASQINHASSQLANQLRNVRGYSSVRFSADRVSREAAQLVRAVSRQRSPGYLRSEFNDLSRRYQDLEETFLRANRGEHNSYVYQQMDRISYLFSNLNAEFYYTDYYERRPPVYRKYPGVRHRGLHPRPGARQPQRRDRRDYGNISATRPLQFDHRSPVLERQYRRQQQNSTETRRRNHWD